MKNDTKGKDAKLTDADKYALEHMPNGWFLPENLTHAIKNREYRCNRLKNMGLLRIRAIGMWPNTDLFYKKKEA